MRPLYPRRGGRRRPPLAALAVPPLLAAGCVTYEPAPLDPALVLAELDEVHWTFPSASADDEAEGQDAPAAPQLAGFAVLHNPALRALRAEIGVAESLLVEAGLLPDPTVGWDGMDALAAEVNGDGATSQDYLAGFGLDLRLLRPGERDARRGAAGWQLEEVRRQVVSAEWELARGVFLAAEGVLASRRLLDQNRELVEVARATHEYFERARVAGTATALEANLALGDLRTIQLQAVRLEAQLDRDDQRLNAMLGLPPGTEIAVRPTDPPAESVELLLERDDLAELAVQRRPDLARLQADYAEAEELLRLEVARQFPQLSIGTGLSLTVPVLSRFNRPAIETAFARREALRGELVSAIHDLRAGVAAARLDLEESRRELAALEGELLPNVEESLRLARESFVAGQASLLEILTVQRALVDARTRQVEARAVHAGRTWAFLAELGLVLHTDDFRAALPSEQRP